MKCSQNVVFIESNQKNRFLEEFDLCRKTRKRILYNVYMHKTVASAIQYEPYLSAFGNIL
jgi:hypothetical protein